MILGGYQRKRVGTSRSCKELEDGEHSKMGIIKSLSSSLTQEHSKELTTAREEFESLSQGIYSGR